MGLLRAIGLLIRAGTMATFGLMKVAALKMALPLLRLTRKVESVVARTKEKASEYEKEIEKERSRIS